MILLALSSPALAYSTGITGYSASGCTCHGASADATTTVSFPSLPASVETGETITVQLTVATTNGSRTAAGLDVSASGGTLAAGSNNRASAGEITHSSRTTMSSGSVTFDMSWTAPTTPGTYTLSAAGNAVNAGGTYAGDGWNLASATIEVAAPVTCADSDGDGWEACSDGSGEDCDDTNADISPAAVELCDGVDEDCSGVIDDFARDVSTWYEDVDGDGRGNDVRTADACEAPTGYVARSGDCDDRNARTYLGAPEICDGEDNDCDELRDEDLAYATYYTDADFDGYGDDATAVTTCDASSGVTVGGDCDDAERGINPGATEECDDEDLDENCNGLADDEETTAPRGTNNYYVDADGDGDGAGAAMAYCDPPAGVSINDSDCDDADPAVYPGAGEVCDGADNDCDLGVDEALPVYYPDEDGDGYGDASGDQSCMPGGVENDDDCDDASASANPDGTEVWYDGVDQDCDGNDDDQDLDTYGVDEDCDDEDDAVYPGAKELWYDGIDSDCDGASDYDADGDTHDSETYGGDDCDDGDPASYPGAPDKPYDGVVTDCVEADEFDQDGDGVDYKTDCDDANSKVTTGTSWYPDADGDGHGVEDGAVVDCDAPKGYAASADDCDDDDASTWDDCGGETGETGEGNAGNGDNAGETGVGKDEGCGCTSTGSPAGGLAALGLALLIRRRR